MKKSEPPAVTSHVIKMYLNKTNTQQEEIKFFLFELQSFSQLKGRTEEDKKNKKQKKQKKTLQSFS